MARWLVAGTALLGAALAAWAVLRAGEPRDSHPAMDEADRARLEQLLREDER